MSNQQYELPVVLAIADEVGIRQEEEVCGLAGVDRMNNQCLAIAVGVDIRRKELVGWLASVAGVELAGGLASVDGTNSWREELPVDLETAGGAGNRREEFAGALASVDGTKSRREGRLSVGLATADGTGVPRETFREKTGRGFEPPAGSERMTKWLALSLPAFGRCDA